MRCSVVPCDRKSCLLIYFDAYGLACFDGTLYDLECVEVLACSILVYRDDIRFEAGCEDLTFVVDLTAHRSIEDSLVAYSDDVVTFRSAVCDLKAAVFSCLEDVDDFRVALKVIVAVVLGACGVSRDLLGNLVYAESKIALCLCCSPRGLLLLLHCSLEAFLVYLETFFFCHLDGKLYREAESIVKIECRIAVDLACTGLLLVIQDLLELLDAVLERALESCDLLVELVQDEVTVLGKERIAVVINAVDVDLGKT